MEELVSLVISDALSTSDMTCRIIKSGHFAIVLADFDWLETKRATVAQLFDRFVLPPSAKPNSHRAEVLLMAVCSGVITLGPAGNFSHNLELSDLPSSFSQQINNFERMLAWKFLA